MITQAGGSGYDSLNVPTSYRIMMYGGQIYRQKNWVLGSAGPIPSLRVRNYPSNN